MRVAVCVLELHIPGSTSLKAKRQVVKSLVQRLRNRFNASISEVGSQDLWQRAEIALAVVCYNGGGADSIMEKIFAYVDRDSSVDIIASHFEKY